MRPGRRGDWSRAMEAFDSAREVNVLGMETRADTVEGLSQLLERHGVEPVAWYGVRFFTEEWGRDQPRTDEADGVFTAELEASRRDPYRQLSRLFHLVGVRR
jgi:S-adenosylmethionine-dependent methyltransferase